MDEKSFGSISVIRSRGRNGIASRGEGTDTRRCLQWHRGGQKGGTESWSQVFRMFSKDRCWSRVTPTNQIRGILVTRTIPGQGDLGRFQVFSTYIHPIFSSSPKNNNVLEAVGFKGGLQVPRNRVAYALPLQLHRPYPTKTQVALQS